MQYASPYTPSYVAAPYAQPYQAFQQPYYPMTVAGQAAAVVVAEAPKTTPLTVAFWKEPTLGIPRWALGAGALALLGTGYLWQRGTFGGKKTTRTTTRTSRDATRRRTTRRTRRSGY